MVAGGRVETSGLSIVTVKQGSWTSSADARQILLREDRIHHATVDIG